MIKLIWTGDLMRINVPWFENVSLWDLYRKACFKNEKIREYFPDYGQDEDGYLPQRDYFWNVYNSIDSADCIFKVQTLMRM